MAPDLGAQTNSVRAARSGTVVREYYGELSHWIEPAHVRQAHLGPVRARVRHRGRGSREDARTRCGNSSASVRISVVMERSG